MSEDISLDWQRAHNEFRGFAAYRPGRDNLRTNLPKPVAGERITPFESHSLVMAEIERIGDLRLIDMVRLSVRLGVAVPLVSDAGLTNNYYRLVRRVARLAQQCT